MLALPQGNAHRKSMDIREIARRAKVSTATVSRTINRVPTVDPQLVKRVWKVIDELGYYPNTQARALVFGRSRIFGLIVSEITNPFFPEIVQVFEDLAVQHNYEILLTSTVHDPKRMELAVRRMIERRVDGVAVMTFGMARRVAFEESMQEIGLEVSPELLVIGDHTMEGGMNAFRKLAGLRLRPSAIICSNDVSAIGVMRETFDFGLRIPQDLSLVGFDDIRLAQFMIPPLTTVQMSQTELGTLAFNALMNEVKRETPAAKGTEYILTTSLVLRNSTALAPAQQAPTKPARTARVSAR
jgi:DNA-binding LacI/PurR family transcriptional regulator